MLNLKSKTGKAQSVNEWVRDMLPEDRVALCQALASHAETAFTGPVSLEKFRADFSRLSKEDCMAFIKGIKEGIGIAESAVIETQLVDAIADIFSQAKAQKEAVRKWV